jgi:MSHA biogenesis protein MshJ
VKAFLARYAERVDSATLRERVLIFAAAALALIAAANLFVLAPLSAKERRLSQQIAQRQGELANIQTQIQNMVRGGDPAEPLRRRTAELKRRLDGLEAEIAAEQKRFTPPDLMRTALEEILERNRRLELVDFKTLPLTALDSGSAAPAKGKPAAPGARHVFRHGVEITVSGTYFDLQAYLQDLEKLPTQIYWGRAELTAQQYPRSTLKLLVYTLSFDKSWIVV